MAILTTVLCIPGTHGFKATVARSDVTNPASQPRLGLAAPSDRARAIYPSFKMYEEAWWDEGYWQGVGFGDWVSEFLEVGNGTADVQVEC